MKGWIVHTARRVCAGLILAVLAMVAAPASPAPPGQVVVAAHVVGGAAMLEVSNRSGHPVRFKSAVVVESYDGWA